MSYLRNCDTDVFISYAHIDNDSMFGQRGWIDVLHQALEVRLAQLLGEKALVWRDPELPGNAPIDDTLRNRLLKTALLLSVVTPRYVQSTSCLDEIEAFHFGLEKSGGLRLQDKARLLKVVKTEVALDKMPEPLQPLLGYEFYARDTAKKIREYPLPPIVGDETYKACVNKLEDLAYDIKITLEALRALEIQQTNGKEVDKARVVYIADTISELRPQADQLKRELRLRGYVVFPCEAAPENGARYREFVATQLEQASLSVHLVGELYGVTLEGETRSTIDVQLEEARRIAAKGGLRRVLWLPERLEAKEKRQADFLDMLRRDDANQTDTELLQTSIENLKTYLLRKLTAPAKAPAGMKSAVMLPMIYLIHDQRDVDAIDPLRDALMSRGYEVKRSYFQGDERELREYHQENLVQCDGALIYYGAADEFWVERKLSDLRKAFGLGRARPYVANAVFVAMPQTPDKERFRTQAALVVKAMQDFSPDALAPFLELWAPRP